MSFEFGANAGAIHALGKIQSSFGYADLTLVLDTGAQTTVVDELYLNELGIRPAKDAKREKYLTASGTVLGSRVIVPKFHALGIMRTNYEITCYKLPSAIVEDGLLGLDFFRGLNLNINFRTGRIQLK